MSFARRSLGLNITADDKELLSLIAQAAPDLCVAGVGLRRVNVTFLHAPFLQASFSTSFDLSRWPPQLSLTRKPNFPRLKITSNHADITLFHTASTTRHEQLAHLREALLVVRMLQKLRQQLGCESIQTEGVHLKELVQALTDIEPEQVLLPAGCSLILASRSCGRACGTAV